MNKKQFLEDIVKIHSVSVATIYILVDTYYIYDKY